MDEHGVFAEPAQSRALGQLSFQQRARVHVGSPLDGAAGGLFQPVAQRFQAAQQHVVVVEPASVPGHEGVPAGPGLVAGFRAGVGVGGDDRAPKRRQRSIEGAPVGANPSGRAMYAIRP